MDSEAHPLHIFFFPVMAPGHMIPIFDIAKLFAARGVKATVLTTPLNAPSFTKAVDRDKQKGMDIAIQLIQFPSIEAGLPEGCESVGSIPSPDFIENFFTALNMLQQPFEEVLKEHRPNCVVADAFFPWATEASAKLGIPRLVFHGTSFFTHCISDSLKRYAPHENVGSNNETFIVPGLPDQIEMTKSQMSYDKQTSEGLRKLHKQIAESMPMSFGLLVNSFYELEPAYAQHYRKVMGRKAWHIGPVSLRNRDLTDKSSRGNKASIDEHECLRWLDSKEPNSVLYVSFGSVSHVSNSQLLEIAMGLEISGLSFIWVVKKGKGSSKGDDDKEEPWLPEGFEERIKGKGLIIMGWAPQILILDHRAVGGFVTHCGWNSILESVSAGVPMITWPIFADQFHNEKLVTQVLKVGVKIGDHEFSSLDEVVEGAKLSVLREEIKKVIKQLMDGGEEAEQMRSRARELRDMAKRAVEEGGSSYADLTALIEELKLYKQPAI